ncbi:MAG: homocysteine S-methyltransferase family protein [Alphaproteobacteria bacterium]
MPGAITLLDGGMGQELRKRGLTEERLWSAHTLMTRPEEVRRLHEEFIDAGAEIITTANYSTTPKRFAIDGLRNRVTDVTRIAAEVANEARRGRGGVRIAGSLPPLLASYEPDAAGTFEEMLPDYEEIVAALAPGVDLFICETMASATESRAAATAAAATGKPIWVSWTLQDEKTNRLRSGETIAEALRQVSALPIDAFLFNCCSPETMTPALPILRAATDRPIGAYANAFTPIPKDWRRRADRLRDLREDLDAEGFASFAAPWFRSGATIVGGCCGASPGHIAALRRLIEATT